MQKRFLIPLLVLAFFLAACDGETPTQVAAADADAPVQEVDTAPEPTQTQPPPTETPELVAEEAEEKTEEEPAPVEFVSECTLVSSPMDPETQYADLFAVTERDWVSGPDTAALTIVEYGDYQ